MPVSYTHLDVYKRPGIGSAKTAVGDKYVYEYMAKNGCRIGGEQSGHTVSYTHLVLVGIVLILLGNRNKIIRTIIELRKK